jgi:hypothetical protein
VAARQRVSAGCAILRAGRRGYRAIFLGSGVSGIVSASVRMEATCAVRQGVPIADNNSAHARPGTSLASSA